VDLSLLRSVLFAPASDEHKLRKALASGADAVVADLEDGTAPDEKKAARDIVEALFTDGQAGCARALRVNAPETEWFAGDLELGGRIELDFLMLPKATPRSLAALGPSGPPVVAIVESAEGLRLAYETASAERVVALALGTHDLGAELRTTPRPDGLEVLYARSKVVADSAAAGRRAPFDTVYVDVGDPRGLEEECLLARTLGLRGKLCIHPGQLEAVNRVFAPSDEEVEWARRVVQAYEQGVREGRGAVALDGRMVDLAVVRRAQRLLAEAGSHEEPPTAG
jgi:citrate lyase beta subunit